MSYIPNHDILYQGVVWLKHLAKYPLLLKEEKKIRAQAMIWPLGLYESINIGMIQYKYENVPDNRGMVEYLCDEKVFTDELVSESLKDYSFNEFTLSELGLPDASTLLESVLDIKNSVGLVGWKSKEGESQSYKGFSLTYNPDFYNKDESIHHQTWGSDLLNQSYGKVNGLGDHKFIKNTYYDTYSFRKYPPAVNQHLGSFLDSFNFPVFRSRVAFYNMFLRRPDNSGWHVDEPPTHMIRVNIPLQTSEEHILEIKGSDEFGNTCNLSKHLEVGKAYIWNTRIPHRVNISRMCLSPKDRIHLVIGLSPWIKYNRDLDSYEKSDYYGMPIKDIVRNKYFVKMSQKNHI